MAAAGAQEKLDAWEKERAETATALQEGYPNPNPNPNPNPTPSPSPIP